MTQKGKAAQGGEPKTALRTTAQGSKVTKPAPAKQGSAGEHSAGKTSPKRSLLETLYLNGFDKELISVVPPKAPISPGSNITPETLGKIPGRRKVNGSWVGGWYHADSTVEAQRMASWNGNIGIETTRLIPIDIDVNDPELHEPLIALARKHFGKNVPIRMGKRPLVILRMDGKCSIGRTAATFTRNGAKHKIETFFGKQKQFVIHGRHPSGVEYTCTPAVENLLYDAIPLAPEAKVLGYITAALELLQTRYGCTAGVMQNNAARLPGEEPPPPEQLIGSTELIKKALANIPNVTGRDDWVIVCHAIKGATQDRPAEGKKLWLEWCETRQDGDPHLKEAARVWSGAGKQSGRVSIGIDALLGTAGLQNEIARRELGDVEVAEDELLEGTEEKPKRVYEVIPSLLMADRDRSWIIRDVVMDAKILGVIWGDPGSNKSTLATAMAVHVALGLPFGGKTVKPGRVLMISEEDAIDHRRRMGAWKEYLAEHSTELDLPDNWQERLMQVLSLNGSFGSASPAAIRALVAAVCKVAHDEPLRMVFVDTMARTFVTDGDENDGVAMNKYIALMEALSEALGCPVILIHHPPKDGGTMRGHSSLKGAIWVEIKVERQEADNTVRMYCEKIRGAPNFSPLSFQRIIGQYDKHREFDMALPEEDRAPRSGIVLEHTEWTEIVGKGTGHGNDKRGRRGKPAGPVEDLGNQGEESDDGTTDAQILEMLFAIQKETTPAKSGIGRSGPPKPLTKSAQSQKIAQNLAVSRQAIEKRLKRIAEKDKTIESIDGGPWRPTKKGRRVIPHAALDLEK